ncbi:hypothetical protein [Streptomyces mexicanus]|uniref:Uncharacterized protein n=1 Tax=Streptomyces mexicanus TaxID=178566 RepID=A0A7X1LPF1_9ACTN|nr:hypothetical protein [Streptomyces mexicanus]MBC2864427.1 hypothetical protein [Streptomyces mexicanus]
MGLVLALHGAIAGRTMTYRLGLVILLVGLAGVVETRIRINTHRLIAHQVDIARITAQERQSFAEMGWKACLLSMKSERPNAAGADIVELPARRTSEMRRDGSA